MQTDRADGPTIWVDADAAPKPIKEILYRAAMRVQMPLVLVANQPLYTPKSKWITTRMVGKGFDVADEWIAEQVQPGDLVITQDVPLAAAVVEKGADVIDVRGEVIDKGNARARLAARHRNEEMREAGVMMGGPKPFGDRDKRQFAGALDRWLARR
jgi:uncharacterized protein YaiI (UPF0178 family)